MSTFKSRMGAGLTALALGSAVVVSGLAAPTPAQAHGHGFGGGFHHGGGWGHGFGWGRGWRYGYVGYAPAYYGGCYLKRFVTYDGDIIFKKVCY